MMKLKYYTLIIVNNAGKPQQREIAAAKAFFDKIFTNYEDAHLQSDVAIQKRLLELSINNLSPSNLLAKRCLLCLISWQIEQVCVSLEQQFGNYHGFTRYDLLGYVLDDDGSLQPSDTYQCLGREILETFNPDKSSLATWTTRKVKQHRELNQYLLECGLYLVSDWAILNDTKPQQLIKILGQFHRSVNLEIEQAQKLLFAYHKVYRAERFRQWANQRSKGRCNPPTNEQIEAIIKILQIQEMDNLSVQVVMEKLQNLASQLREYRIHVRNGSLPTVSLDAELNQNSTLIEKITDENSVNIINETEDRTDFLKSYRIQIVKCFDNALNTVITSRLQKLEKKKTDQKNLNIDKGNQFLIALQLFHCQRLSMGKIAQRLGLRAQDAVARLLKLKEFRADVSQETLVKLREKVIELAQEYSTPSSLVNLEARITEALDEQITNVISQAEIEAASMQNNCEISYFSQRLCQHLDNRELLNIEKFS
ncbi:hypothetical protein NIES4101_85870 [Calothrix sp. NIES-4101]|nr:hypothetical protein NIES4101_85870 [Calothrix sp. NIES-4101]